MNIIYKTQITNMGKMAQAFLESNMFIIFKDNAPEELTDYCYVHNDNDLKEIIKVNDTLYIDDVKYNITAVGDAVNDNLRQLGHITLKFTGDKEASLPGTLFLERKKIVPPHNGTIIKIIRN